MLPPGTQMAPTPMPRPLSSWKAHPCHGALMEAQEQNGSRPQKSRGNVCESSSDSCCHSSHTY